MREDNFFRYSLQAVAVYEETVKSTSEQGQRQFQKVYNNLNKMLEECYFVGASRFGHNFIA